VIANLYKQDPPKKRSRIEANFADLPKNTKKGQNHQILESGVLVTKDGQETFPHIVLLRSKSRDRKIHQKSYEIPEKEKQ